MCIGLPCAMLGILRKMNRSLASYESDPMVVEVDTGDGVFVRFDDESTMAVNKVMLCELSNKWRAAHKFALDAAVEVNMSRETFVVIQNLYNKSSALSLDVDQTLNLLYLMDSELISENQTAVVFAHLRTVFKKPVCVNICSTFIFVPYELECFINMFLFEHFDSFSADELCSFCDMWKASLMDNVEQIQTLFIEDAVAKMLHLGKKVKGDEFINLRSETFPNKWLMKDNVPASYRVPVTDVDLLKNVGLIVKLNIGDVEQFIQVLCFFVSQSSGDSVCIRFARKGENTDEIKKFRMNQLFVSDPVLVREAKFCRALVCHVPGFGSIRMGYNMALGR